MTVADPLTRPLGGKYRLLERIGVDGEIERYRAEHVGIGRTVEVRCLAAGARADGEAAQALVQGARALGGATHRNVQGVVDSGRDAEGRPHVVLEALRGEPLGALLRDAPLEPVRAVGIVMQLLEGLRALHAAEVVLGGFEPDDVMVERVRAGYEHVKLRGAVRRAPDGPRSIDAAFRAPERGPLDRRADLFSAGVILRALLTGRIDGALDLRSDLARRAIERACADDPDERFASADGLLQAVSLLLPSADRSPEPDPPRDRLHADLRYLHLRRTTRQGVRVPSEAESRLSLLPVLLTIEAIYRRFGPSVWAAIRERVEDAETLLPGAGHTPTHIERGVRVGLVAEVLRAADQIVGQGDLALLPELGDAVARRGLSRLLPQLPDPLTPDALVDAWPSLWRSVARDGEARVSRRGPGSARLSVSGQATPSLELSGVMAGLLRRASVEAGAADADVVLIASEALGDSLDLYGIAWR